MVKSTNRKANVGLLFALVLIVQLLIDVDGEA